MVLTASALAGVGACAVAWPFIDSMNPAADVLALSSIEVDLSPIKEGQTIKVKWRGVPVFIFHEGGTEPAGSVFRQIAQITHGAYSVFDARSPQQLRDLLKAVAIFAAGGRTAMVTTFAHG